MQLVGLDVGTTSCKAGLFDTHGRLLALTSASYGLSRPQPGYVEQDPEQYWDAAVRCVRNLLASPAASIDQLAAVCACGQAPTLVLLDSDRRPLRPAILWQDTRAAAEAERLARDPGSDTLAEWLGLRWPVDASLPLARLLWLRQHEPESLARTAAVVLPKDYVHLRLSGTIASDNWSAKGLAHLTNRQPLTALRDLCGLDPSVAPAALTSHQVMGHVSTEGATATGLPAGLPIAAGWTDAMSAMLGSGALGTAGLACDVSGTSEVVGLTLPARPVDTGLLMCAPVLDSGRWMLYGPTQASGASLGWALRTFRTPPHVGPIGRAVDSTTTADADQEAALAAAARVAPGAGGLVFLPYLEGERAPVWDPRARGVLLGLSTSHTPSDLYRAVLEGVACSVRHILTAAIESGGHPLQEVRVAGGGARLSIWNQIKADLTGYAFRPCAVTENGVLGAAMLGAIGAGIFTDVESASAAMVQVGAAAHPDPTYRAAYDRTYVRYTTLYPKVRELYA